MARIRSIHPDACKSRKLARSSGDAERTYFRLQIHCDDEGRVEDETDVLAALMFQAGAPDGEGGTGPVQAEQADRWLAELHAVGLILRYQVAGLRLIQVVGWRQRPNRPTPSALPAASEADSVSTHGGLSEDSVSTHCSREGVVVAVAVAAREPIDRAVDIVAERRSVNVMAGTKANPSAWAAAARRGIRDELLAVNTIDPLLAADTVEPPRATPTRPEDVEQQRNRDCELCHGSLMASDDDGAYPCPTCNP